MHIGPTILEFTSVQIDTKRPRVCLCICLLSLSLCFSLFLFLYLGIGGGISSDVNEFRRRIGDRFSVFSCSVLMPLILCASDAVIEAEFVCTRQNKMTIGVLPPTSREDPDGVCAILLQHSVLGAFLPTCITLVNSETAAGELLPPLPPSARVPCWPCCCCRCCCEDAEVATCDVCTEDAFAAAVYLR